MADWNLDNSVYYRLVTSDKGPTVVCMQWFDETGYDQSRFLNTILYEYEADAWRELLRLTSFGEIVRELALKMFDVGPHCDEKELMAAIREPLTTMGRHC